MKKGIFYLIIFCFALVFIELCSYTGTYFLWEKGVLYSPPKVELDEYESYLDERDAVLGWPTSRHFSIFYDKSGSRFIPAFLDPDKYRSYISIYGDSFTYGTGVSPEDTYCNVLSKLLNCRVSNYGVEAYGTDQAYLRFRENIKDDAQIVILGYTTENIIRNVNRYRSLMYKISKLSLKPRFIIDSNDRLKLISLPRLDYKEFLQIINFPEKYLKHEYFLPGGKAGICKRKFPYTFSLIKVISKNFHIKAKIKGIPYYKEFYEIDHPSNALTITFHIISEFYSTANKHNKKPIILIIPTGQDLQYYYKNKKWIYEHLIKKLDENNIEYIDMGPQIIKYLKDKKLNSLFYKINTHYNVEGHKILAEILYGYLIRYI